MKRLIFSAILATVAIGGAFATKTTKVTNATRYQQLTSPQACQQLTCSNVEKETFCAVSESTILYLTPGTPSTICTTPVSDAFIYSRDL
ncbi:DUF6520 family protein [Pedobacter metabolipauper]|uniref:Uncharacterized protein n=1 Tax=Pedobacter metabolipauper TaxID=425513 RepID=A0A4R6SWG3_9SPHI|nr:DUF6520 family protein [Pedobacter metabolipauper]TDQ08472.1 hypothetical protein ATK78_2986 [Pedobacter metabolipauper]